jgi:hypothetical protein
MKLFKNKKRFAAVFAVIATVMTLGWALAAYTNVLNPVFGNDTAFANPPADDCIHLVDGIHVNLQNANADIRLVSPCGVRQFQMKAWYAPSASGAPHDQQVLFAASDTVTARVRDANPTHINVKMLPQGCFYQVDIVDVTNPPNGGYPVVAAVTGGNHDWTPPEFACTGLSATPGAKDQTTGNQTFTLGVTASVKHGTIVRYNVNFGDGTSATAPTAATSASLMHTYAPGSYTATATVTVRDAGGNLSTSPVGNCQAPINVTPPQPPEKKLSCDNLTATAGRVEQNGNQAYSFTASATAQNTTITSYVFDFGDGNDQTVNTGATTANASHTYAPGEYDATVTVHAGAQQATSDKCKVHIKVKKPEAKLACVKLTATPGAVQQNGDQAYSFTANATAQNATITSYRFDFGDGNDQTVNTGATTANASHTYAPGEYTAQVFVNGNVTSDACKVNIKVKKPEAKLSCDSLKATAGAVDPANGNQAYSFTAKATAQNTTITSYDFAFGDGQNTTVTTSDTTATADHTYAPGEYTAMVTVNTANDHKTSDACKVKIKVKEQPGAKLICNSLTATAGSVNEDDSQNYTLNAAASVENATITDYVFNFGDASANETVTTSNTTASADHVYQPGTWSASVTVNGKNAAGAVISSTTKNCKVTIKVKTPECQPGVPEGSPKCFEYVCNAFTVTKGDNRTVKVASFDASSTNPNATLSKVVVDWGDNSADLETTKDGVVGQSHQFAADGTYTVTAVAHFTADGKDFTASGPNCAQAVSFTTTPPVTPPQVLPATLVNTGPGSVAAITAAVAAISAIAYRFVLGRKLSN